jgi:hypothetical protein
MAEGVGPLLQGGEALEVTFAPCMLPPLHHLLFVLCLWGGALKQTGGRNVHFKS